MLRKALVALCTEKDELRVSIQDATRRSIYFRELVFKLQTQVRQEDEARGETDNKTAESAINFEFYSLNNQMKIITPIEIILLTLKPKFMKLTLSLIFICYLKLNEIIFKDSSQMAKPISISPN